MYYKFRRNYNGFKTNSSNRRTSIKKKIKKVEKIDEKIIQLLDDMAETMYDADGVGLAAPQVGILKE